MKNKKLLTNYIYNTLYQILVLIAPLVTIPYVSRVLGVTNIGIYQYSQSIATYFVLIGAGGVSIYGQREIAYLQDKRQERTKAFGEIEVFHIFSVLLLVIIYAFTFFSFGKYKSVYQILIIEIIASAFDISWFFMGMENFKSTVLRNTVIKFAGVILVFLLVKTSNDLLTYTACLTIPILAGNISLWISLNKYIDRTHIDVSVLVSGVVKRLKPILILFIPQIAIEVYTVLDKTMLGIFATNIDQVGFYSQAQRIVRLILTIVTSLGTVMLPSMSAAFANKDNIKIVESFKVAFRFIFLLSAALMFGLCAIASRFVPVFFGEGYDPVILLLVVISPVIMIIASSNIISYQFLLPTGRQRQFTISILLGASVNFLLNIILIHFYDAVGASIATIIAELTVTGTQCWLVRKEIPIKNALLSGVKYLFYGAIMFLAVSGVGMLLPAEKIWALAVMIIIGVIVYMGELLLTKDPMVKMGLGLIKKKA